MIHVFIVNPKCAPKGFAAGLREELSKIPELNYYVLTSREAGYETELVRMMERIFEGEIIRFYSCGGSGTARNILAGFSNMDRDELAVIPLGRVDYLKAFDDQEAFSDIHAMVNGDVIHTDYIRTNNGPALNSASVGMDTFALRASENLRGFRAFGKNVPQTMSHIYSILFSTNSFYDIQVNDLHLNKKCGHISLGNIPVLGGNVVFAKDRDVTDGQGTCLISPALNAFSKISMRSRLLKHEGSLTDGEKDFRVMPAASMRVRRRNGAPFWMNLDGELVMSPDWQIEVVRQGLRFVVPRRRSDGK